MGAADTMNEVIMRFVFRLFILGLIFVPSLTLVVRATPRAMGQVLSTSQDAR